MLLRLPPDEEEELNAKSFSKMNKLRLLKICKVHLSCLNYLSNELCLLEWHDYLLESLPKSIHSRCGKCDKCQIFCTFTTPNTKNAHLSNVLNVLKFYNMLHYHHNFGTVRTEVV